jgi:hypothetical protein
MTLWTLSADIHTDNVESNMFLNMTIVTSQMLAEAI